MIILSWWWWSWQDHNLGHNDLNDHNDHNDQENNAVLTAAHCVRYFTQAPGGSEMIILILMVYDHHYHAMVMIDKTSDELEIRCGDLDVTGEEMANEVIIIWWTCGVVNCRRQTACESICFRCSIINRGKWQKWFFIQSFFKERWPGSHNGMGWGKLSTTTKNILLSP